MKHSRLLPLVVVLVFTISLITYSGDTNQQAFLGGFFRKISQMFKSRQVPKVSPTISPTVIYNKPSSPDSKNIKSTPTPKTTSNAGAGLKPTSNPTATASIPTSVSTPSVNPTPPINSGQTSSPQASPPQKTPVSVRISDIEGLLAYWNFDEGSGTIIYESSPDGVNGKILNISTTAWLDFGKVGRSLELDGYDDYIYIESLPAVNLGAESQSYSISFWVKRNGNPPYESGIVSKNDGTGRYPFAVTIQKDGRISFQLYDGANLSRVTSDPITDNGWKHVVAVRDSANKQLKLYINNKPLPAVGDTTKGSLKNNDYILIGRYPFGDGSFYHDSFVIDEVRLYGTALNDVEVKALYEVGSDKVSLLMRLLSLIAELF